MSIELEAGGQAGRQESVLGTQQLVRSVSPQTFSFSFCIILFELIYIVALQSGACVHACVRLLVCVCVCVCVCLHEGPINILMKHTTVTAQAHTNECNALKIIKTQTERPDI